ncbi:cyclic GMP-AMP synthase [Mytilus galloprovincialis]|nr:cyclic GMP-AMP synthase [Mytilus galloprovincialis]
MGTEELVLLRQKFYLLYDLLRLSRTEIIINSGSKSEGLELEGSDIDIMILQLDNTVLENENEAQCKNNQPNVFFMSTEDTKPGFTMLKLSKSSFIPYDSQVYYYWDTWRNNIVLSSEKAKQWMSSKWENSALVHGPCITDEDYESDIAFCLRCPIWIKQARKLREKSRLWPCPSVVEIIEKCGILFVPIGCKTSATEEFEWRISFSIAEKLLIYTFSHTQILCYALLKIMLKEIIETHSDSKGILCSYFLKTVVFWVSEEFQRDKWRPDMIIPCFMACLARLAYCVEHSNLPHYFIPEINLLEDKLVSHNTTDLKNLLNEFFSKRSKFFKIFQNTFAACSASTLFV